MSTLISRPTEATAPWLSAVLGRRVDSVLTERIGTGQMGACFRVETTGEGGPARMVLKLPAGDRAAIDMIAGAYRKEVRFYRDLADTVAVNAPACLYSAMAEEETCGDFTLILEDLAPRTQGDQVRGCTRAQARAAVVNLAGLHGPRWCDPTLTEHPDLPMPDEEAADLLAGFFEPTLETFWEIMGDRVAPADVATVRALAPVVRRWSLARSERFAIVHADYRLDNLMFAPAGSGDERVYAVDWQTYNLGLPARDLAYFLGTGLTIADRRLHEESLVADYHAALLGHGVRDYTAVECWDDYRFAMLQGPLVAVFGCAYGTRTERGDEMFALMIERSCAAIRDLGSLDLA